MRALTEQVAVDETELEEEGLAEVLLDDNSTAKLPRLLSDPHLCSLSGPGTSFKRPITNGGGTSQGIRCVGVVSHAITTQTHIKERPSSHRVCTARHSGGRLSTPHACTHVQSTRPTTMEAAVKAPRTALATARPVTTASGRFVRLGLPLSLCWSHVTQERL